MSDVLHIIIVEDDVNDYESLLSTIKSAGFAIRAKRAEDVAGLSQALNGHSPDMVLCSMDCEAIDLRTAITCLENTGKQTPVLALGSEGNGNTVECMRIGAFDLVDKGNIEHLKLVITRTAQNQSHWKLLKQYEAALNETEKRCRNLLDSSRDAICYIHEGMHLYANKPYLELFGYSSLEELDDVPIMNLVDSEHQSTMKEFLRNRQQSDKSTQLEIRLASANVDAFDAILEFSSASVDAEPCIQIIIRDLSSNKELEQQINYLSMRDVATGLYNRQHLLQKLARAIEDVSDNDVNSSLIQIDIGNLNDIKENFGVTANDQVIASIAKTLEQTCKQSDVVARFSDESFMIISSAYSSRELTAYANKIATAIANQITELDGKSIVIKPCLGAVQIDEYTPDINELLLRSKNASEQAWELESESAVIYTPKEGEMTQSQIDQAWSVRLRNTIEDGRVRILFQPVVSLHGDSNERYEVTLELRDEDSGIILQDEYLPSAERSGSLKVLDQWVVNSAVRRLSTIKKSRGNTSFIIPITAGTLQNHEFTAQLQELLEDQNVSAKNLIFSAREAVIVNYLKSAKALIKQLQTMQCKFLIDNFGIGLNPTHIMKAVPVDYVKLDKIIMKDLRKHPENLQTIQNLSVSLKTSKKMLVAPYVDDAETLSILWSIGIDYIQGNFLQPPAETLDYDFSSMG